MGRQCQGLKSVDALLLLLLNHLKVKQGGVVHDVAHLMNALGDAFVFKVANGCFGRTEAPGGEVVGEDAVLLFGHTFVVASEAGFNMGHGDMQLGSSQSAGEGAVGVAVNQDKVGFFEQKCGFNLDEHLSRHRAMTQSADLQVDVGLGNLHIAKKDF